jgi:hypothetical protein
MTLYAKLQPFCDETRFMTCRDLVQVQLLSCKQWPKTEKLGCVTFRFHASLGRDLRTTGFADFESFSVHEYHIYVLSGKMSLLMIPVVPSREVIWG